MFFAPAFAKRKHERIRKLLAVDNRHWKAHLPQLGVASRLASSRLLTWRLEFDEAHGRIRHQDDTVGEVLDLRDLHALAASALDLDPQMPFDLAFPHADIPAMHWIVMMSDGPLFSQGRSVFISSADLI